MKIDMRDAFFERLVELARLDNRIIVLSADHGAFALKRFEEEMPERFINMGIAEQNMVGVAAGLAASGKIVFIYGITPFVSLRVLEQLTIDVAAMQLPVNVISVGAGFTYSTDGPTHQGLQDISAVATIPGMTILNSSDPINTRAFVEMAVASKKPHYIRIEKEKLATFDRTLIDEKYLTKGFSILESGNSQNLAISSGSLSHDVLAAAKAYGASFGSLPKVLDLHQIKPLVADELGREIEKSKVVLTFEESYVSSGLSMIISQLCMQKKWKGELYSLGIKEDYVFIGSGREDLKERLNLSQSGILEFMKLNFK
jgi:transketolase